MRETRGFYTRWRWIFVYLTQLFFYGLPWLTWNHRQAVLFDLTARKFYLFGLVLWPQDFIYLALLLIICAYTLFLFTAIVGRVWCGFACPQTVYTEIFMWVERKIEGTRSARIRLDRDTLSVNKIFKKLTKHSIWLLISIWTGFTFVGYFTEIHTLMKEILMQSTGPWETFWIGFYGLATYGNAGWMREQICRYLCPYARFQGSMLDADSLIVSYDQQRGEPRQPFNKNAGQLTPQTSCIDCSLCVQVCPTGIDIRNGLQHDCIGCAACIDACDSVMDKIHAPRGLIRFSTENALKNALSPKQIKQRMLRPRVLIYSFILFAILISFTSAISMHMPLKMNIIRDRNNSSRGFNPAIVSNVYRLHIMNSDEKMHQYMLAISGIDGASIRTSEVLELHATESRTIPVTVSALKENVHHGANKISFTLKAIDDERIYVEEKSSFFSQ
ncbi:cytochrome c oxidase accessory protein CcoG [Undibacterium sp. SXout7W]|uniref:cytochrome c oxidase accessory protein CcoG n=1 Tax=Undibacterium sp. SXout7W TaxID=3413049 RepID=UPI003BEF7855